jgi:endonuclease/exonuclease/phosphatase family metal-dependent hydrolase
MKQQIILSDAVIPANQTLRLGSLNLLNNFDQITQRVDALVEELKDKDLDVLCLQEVLTSEDLKVVETLQKELGFKTSKQAPVAHRLDGRMQGNAILVKAETEFKILSSYVEGSKQKQVFQDSVAAQFTYNGQEINVLTAHFTWGGDQEWVRLRQAEQLNDYAEKLLQVNPKAIVLLAGDFNAIDTSDTMRYFYGQGVGSRTNGTLWVDAWKIHGTEHNYVTNDPEMHWGKQTSSSQSSHGIHSLTPKRRIDYILSFGWAYGKPGSPLNFHRFADNVDPATGLEISDHYGVYSDIYVP